MRTARFNGHLGGGVVVCLWSGVEVSASGLGDVCLWSHWVSACGLGDVCLWTGGCLPLVLGVSASASLQTAPGQTPPLGRHLTWADTPFPAQYMLGYTNPYP